MLWLAAASRSSSVPLATVTTPVTVDREPSTGVVVQRVGDRVVGRVGVARQSGHADHRAIGGVFVNGVGRGVAVGDAVRHRIHRRH